MPIQKGSGTLTVKFLPWVLIGVNVEVCDAMSPKRHGMLLYTVYHETGFAS